MHFLVWIWCVWGWGNLSHQRPFVKFIWLFILFLDIGVLCLSTGCWTYLFLLFSKFILFKLFLFWKYGVLSYFIFKLLMNFLKWFCAVVLLKIDQCDSWVVLATYLKPFYGEKMFLHPLHFVNLILDICPGDKLSIFTFILMLLIFLTEIWPYWNSI